LILVYLQTLNSKKTKYENAYQEQEKKGSAEAAVKKIKDKLKNLQKKLDELNAEKYAILCQEFQDKLVTVKMSKMYTKELLPLQG
jgi:predicted translin family RNA/ssDNA-binding protein